MKNIDLIITDIDGTLVNSKKVIPLKTKEFLLNLEKKGTKIALCSGRMPAELYFLEDELKLDTYEGYLIHTNGSGIINCKTKKEHSFSPIELNELKELVDLARKSHLYTTVEYNDSYIQECRYTTHFFRFLIRTFWPKKVRPNYLRLRQLIYITNHSTEVDDIFKYLNKPVNKVDFRGLQKNVDRMESYLQKHSNTYGFCRLNPNRIEVSHASVNKGTAVLFLLEQLKLSQENVYAFGDSANDHDMLRVIQNSVAMTNADQQTKQLAKYTTKSNDEDGIYWFFEKNSTF